MDSTHVIALIASNIMVRNQLAVSMTPKGERSALMESLGDPIEEAKQLIEQVMSDEPAMPDAPNTRGGMPSEPVGG